MLLSALAKEIWRKGPQWNTLISDASQSVMMKLWPYPSSARESLNDLVVGHVDNITATEYGINYLFLPKVQGSEHRKRIKKK